MDFRTKLLYKLYRYRIGAIERYSCDAENIQRRQLSIILKIACKTSFGKLHNINTHFSITEFSQYIPVNTYESIKPFIDNMLDGGADILHPNKCKWFAKSSGTTNDKSKFIPVPKDYLYGCHYRGGQDTLAIYLRNNPDSKLVSTKSLVLGGSHTPITLNSDIRVGDLSAILIQNIPLIGEMMKVPSKNILLMGEWNKKMEAIVKDVSNKNIGSLSGVPSWILVMLKNVLEYTGKTNIAELWPNIEVFFHGGISFEPYRKIYEEIIPKSNMKYVDIYNASEGFFAIQDDLSSESLLLMLDYGIYYEFIPISELDENSNEYKNIKPIPLWEVEIGKTYAMVITTLGGLYRYLIGDTVKFVSIKPYKIIIIGRTKQYINAFGEELMVGNAEKAIAKTSTELGIKIKDFTVAPEFFTNKAKGRHQWLIEIDGNPNIDLEEFANRLDYNLQSLNSDYEAKRYSDMTLYNLSITIVPNGFFHSWLARQGKLGGQHKIPRLCNSRKYIDNMLELLRNE